MGAVLTVAPRAAWNGRGKDFKSQMDGGVNPALAG